MNTSLTNAIARLHGCGFDNDHRQVVVVGNQWPKVHVVEQDGYAYTFACRVTDEENNGGVRDYWFTGRVRI